MRRSFSREMPAAALARAAVVSRRRGQAQEAAAQGSSRLSIEQ